MTHGLVQQTRMLLRLPVPVPTLTSAQLQVQATIENSQNRCFSSALPLSNNRSPLYLTKPSWVVRTQSNVRRQLPKKPDPPCVVCNGSGRVDCHSCRGRGRTNYVHLAMLPKGEWPKWCRTCGGSGLYYCSRCLGTGEYRYIMGFHFMKKDDNEIQINGGSGFQVSKDPRSAADRLLTNDRPD